MSFLLRSVFLLLLVLTVGGCDLVGDVLEFGFWLGVIGVVVVIVVIALIVWLIREIF